jgi:hypothetical protein
MVDGRAAKERCRASSRRGLDATDARQDSLTARLTKVADEVGIFGESRTITGMKDERSGERTEHPGERIREHPELRAAVARADTSTATVGGAQTDPWGQKGYVMANDSPSKTEEELRAILSGIQQVLTAGKTFPYADADRSRTRGDTLSVMAKATEASDAT